MKIGFILCSGSREPMPSTRIAVLNMLPFLEATGLSTHILFEPQQPTETPNLAGVAELAIATRCNVVVFQKVRGTDAISLARQLDAAGIRTVFIVCDRVDVEMAQVTDSTVVVTDYLRSLYPAELQYKVHVIHDGIENPIPCKADWGEHIGTHAVPLRAVLVTSATLDHLPVMQAPPDWINVRIVGRYQLGHAKWREMRLQWLKQNVGEHIRYLRFLMSRNITCVPWSSDGVYSELAQADVGILPITPGGIKWGDEHAQAWLRKSENRLTLKMSMGLPVIATPIPSYEPIIKHGVNGFFATTKEEWCACLCALRDPARRREMGLAARASVTDRFSMQEQARRLIAVLQ